jgi:hypothetical protein
VLFQAPSFFIINTNMATTKVIDRQPTKLDYASPTQFKFGINQLPKVEFFTVTVNIPGISLGETVFPHHIKIFP